MLFAIIFVALDEGLFGEYYPEGISKQNKIVDKDREGRVPKELFIPKTQDPKKKR